MFVQYLATHSYKHGQGKENKALTYSDLSRTAEKSETFQFLAGRSSPNLQLVVCKMDACYSIMVIKVILVFVYIATALGPAEKMIEQSSKLKSSGIFMANWVSFKV